MKKIDVINALRLGLDEALDIIEYYCKVELKSEGSVDPAVLHQIQNLEQLLARSEYFENEDETPQHPLYSH